MESPAFRWALLTPFVCWLLGLFAMRKMNRTRKNALSGLSLIFTLALMIALTLFREAVGRLSPAPDRLSAKTILLSVTLVLFCGVGIFWRAWSLYVRDRLSADEIAPYCAACFAILIGAAVSFHIACLFTPVR
ncbi:MAG: hypothetical protein IJK52_08550 [Oscillospiraceae bacterium]|nr:hypothetical protein [Oscillospiraceae bacterium]